MSYAVELNDVHKHFGSIHALRGLSLHIEKGITYGLLGPNGAGKTTAIRVIMGLVKPDQGTVRVLDSAPNPVAEGNRARVGYMTQSIAMYEDLTVYQNVQFFAAMCGLRDNQKAAIDEVIELVDLKDRAHSRIRELSGGMQRRASLACALVHRPEVVMLDEPTVGVDPQLRVQFWEHFHRLNAQGVTLIVSSHVMDEAERCDRLGFIRDGVLLAEGSAKELLARAGTSTLEEAFLLYADRSAALSV